MLCSCHIIDIQEVVTESLLIKPPFPEDACSLAFPFNNSQLQKRARRERVFTYKHTGSVSVI